MMPLGDAGFGGLSGGKPMPSGRPPVFGAGAPMPGPAQGLGKPPQSSAPTPVPVSGLPASTTAQMSPLSMWQNWLQTMGPYLAQQPTSQPGADSLPSSDLNSAGGLSSLTPSSVGANPMGSGLAGYYGPGTPFQGSRGFRGLSAA